MGERSKYSKDQHHLRASLEADDNNNMKSFAVFFFFFCTFVSLGALAQPQWFGLGTFTDVGVGHLLGSLGLGPLGGGRTSGMKCAAGCFSSRQEGIPKCMCP